MRLGLSNASAVNVYEVKVVGKLLTSKVVLCWSEVTIFALGSLLQMTYIPPLFGLTEFPASTVIRAVFPVHEIEFEVLISPSHDTAVTVVLASTGFAKY